MENDLMKNRFKAVFVMLVVTLACMCGCGSEGIVNERPLVKLNPSIAPNYLGNTVSNVDIAQDLCTRGTDSGQLEYMADHNATVTFVATPVISNATPTITITIDRYTIDYVALSDSPNAPPIASETANKTMVLNVSGSGGVFTETVSFVDSVRKIKYMSDMKSGSYSAMGFNNSGMNTYYGFNNYNAKYTFYGKDNEGQKYSASASHNFEIGDFDYCKQ